jgi:hypothetical protein
MSRRHACCECGTAAVESYTPESIGWEHRMKSLAKQLVIDATVLLESHNVC